MARTRADERLKFTTDAGEAVRGGEAVFICVGTPPLETGDADLSAIDNVARLIATEARSSKLVVVAARKGSLKGPGTRVWDGAGGTGGMNGGSVGAAGADGAAAFSPPEAEG